MGGEVLSCCWPESDASADGGLVINKTEDGIRACVVRIRSPPSTITCCLQNAEELNIVYFSMSSQAPPCFKMVVCVNRD